MQTQSLKHEPALRAPAGRQLVGRAGLTLVELLVTISIIAILSGLFLGALQVAAGEAKSMKTKSMIAKLNNLIMPRYEAYFTRRVPLNLSVGGVSGGTNTSAAQMASAAQQRLAALHKLMRFEMPERWSDICDTTATPLPSPPYPVGYFPQVSPAPELQNAPALAQAYYNAYHAAAVANRPPPSGTNEGAETLYLIVSLGFVDELGGRDLFNESNVGDTDGDGFPEFLDGWGSPIKFLRWAPGFTDSDLNGGGGIIASSAAYQYIYTPSPVLGVVQSPITVNATEVIVTGSTGSPAAQNAYGLARTNNAYAGRTALFYVNTGPGGSPVVESATVYASQYNGTPGPLTTSGQETLLQGQTVIYLTTALTFAPLPLDSIGIDPDPFDPAQVFPNANAVYQSTVGGSQPPTPIVPFAIYPLIYSAGPDRTYGVLTDFNPVFSYSTANVTTPSDFPFLVSANEQRPGTTADISGEQTSNPAWQPSGWVDNIHNHLIGTR